MNMSKTNRDKALEVLETFSNNSQKAAEEVLTNGPDSLTLYVLRWGFDTLKSSQRRNKRREIKSEIQPKYVPGNTTGKVVLSKETQERLKKRSEWLSEWMIGSVSLGDFTKAMLLAQSESEKNSARGSLQNSKFYEALAEPLRTGQLVREHWRPDDASKIRRAIVESTKDRQPELT